MKRPASVQIDVAAVITAAALLFGCAAPAPATPPADGAATSAASAVASARPAVSPSPSISPTTPPSDGTATSIATAVETTCPIVSPSPSLASQYEDVEFGAECGPTLRGRLWSEGSVGVVLAHGFSTDTGQDDWNAFAEYLAGLGYGVLTFDFRGFCDRDGCSERPMQLAENWRDVEAAVGYLRSRGSERIFIIGASMGGLAAFRAADEAKLDLAGIVSLATPQYPSKYYTVERTENDVTPERLQRIAAPKLFIAGDDDVQLPSETPLRPGVESVRFADDARAMFEASPEPKQIEIVDSYLHSSSLVIGTRPDEVDHTRQLIVAFIEEHA
jgi:predicted alpha/beta-hydrolase family hydrolase